MRLSELIASSAEIYSIGLSENPESESHYSSSYTFAHKEFGQILQYNKSVVYRPNYDIVEIGLIITQKTEVGKTGHFCQIALKGIDMKPVSKNDIFKKVRERRGGQFANYSDAEVMEYVARGETVFNGKYVIQSRRDSNVFLVMNKKISLDTEVKVRCSCASFYFDIAWYNAKANCLIGSPPPSNPKFKVNPEAVPVRNVKKKPGLCKHLMLLASLLMKDDFLAGGTDDPNGIKESSYSIFNKRKHQERISTIEANARIDSIVSVSRKIMKQAETQKRVSKAIYKAQKSDVPKVHLYNAHTSRLASDSIKRYLSSIKSSIYKNDR